MSVFGRRNQRGRIRPLNGQMSTSGSARSGSFIRDAISGSDSVAIVTIGDSNSIYAQADPDGAGAYTAASMGWTSGWARALHALGAQMYASPLMPTLAGAGTGTTGTNMVAGTFTQFPVYAGSPLSNKGALDTTDIVYALSGQSGAVPDALKPIIIPNSTLRPFGLVGWDAAYLPAASIGYRDFSQYLGHYGADGLVTSGANKTFIQASGSYKHRVFHITLTPNTPLGSMSLRVRNTTTSGDLLTQSVTTHGADYSYVSSAGSWTATVAGTENIRGGWGYLTTATPPAMPMMESWERPSTKGFSVQNLHGYAGATSTTIASDVDGIDSSGSAMLETYLWALVERQQACGGTGRVLVHMNFGINGGGDDFATWKAACESIMAQFRTSWAAAGYNPVNLAFLLEVTHDLYAYSVGSTRLNLVATRAAALAWGASGHGDATVCDLSKVAPGATMEANSWYSASGSANEIHLGDSGYLGVRSAAIGALVA